VSVLLLRHVHAGERADWRGDDRRRPISAQGRREATAIVAQYEGRPVDRILSSPYDRCVQSVEPLAAARGLHVEEEDALAEGAPLDVVRRLLASVADEDVVLCSHGDVIGALVQDLHLRGVEMPGGLRWQKASTWVLEGDPRRPGTVHYLPPPDA
jgi:8-oxo-dGTP diphosphatase